MATGSVDPVPPVRSASVSRAAAGSFVFGLLAIPLWFMLLPAAMAIVLGAVVAGQARTIPTDVRGRKLGKWGMWLGIVSLIGWVVGAMIFLGVFTGGPGA